MRKSALLTIVFLLGYQRGMHAQTAAMVAPIPVFQPLDNNGNIVPGGTLCSYTSGSSARTPTFTDATGTVANTNPVILDASGRANIWLTTTTKLVFSKPGTGCPSTGAQIWSIDGIAPVTDAPLFSSVTSSTVFNSDADINGGNAFQTSGGTMFITGSGNGEFQEVGANHFSLTGFVSAPTPPGAGFAFLYYDTALAALRYNLGGAGWVSFGGGVAGADGQIQFNNMGAFGATTNLTWNNSTEVLGITGATTSGITAPVFSSTNTGSNNAFVAGSGAATITGAGNVAAQNYTAHSVFNSAADVNGGNAFQTSTGTAIITGAGAISGQSVSVSTGYTAASTAGVSCPSGVTAGTVVVVGGIVTHC